MVQTSDASFIQKTGDGLAHTLLLSENYDAGLWHQVAESRTAFIFYPPGTQPGHYINGPTRPGPASFLNARPASYHSGGVNVLFAGGNGQYLAAAIDYAVYCALMTPNGSASREPGSTQPSPASITVQPGLPWE